jgi:hypothetical protein
MNEKDEALKNWKRKLEIELARAKEIQQLKDQPVDFETGFICGVQGVTLDFMVTAILSIINRVPANEIIAMLVSNAHGMHAAAHVCNGEEPECADVEYNMAKLTEFFVERAR